MDRFLRLIDGESAVGDRLMGNRPAANRPQTGN